MTECPRHLVGRKSPPEGSSGTLGPDFRSWSQPFQFFPWWGQRGGSVNTQQPWDSPCLVGSRGVNTREPWRFLAWWWWVGQCEYPAALEQSCLVGSGRLWCEHPGALEIPCLVGRGGGGVNTPQPWDSPAWWGEEDGVNTPQPWDSPRPSSKCARILHGSPNS